MSNNNKPDEKLRREAEDAEVLDDVQEAQSETQSTEDEENEIINSELNQIDALNEQVKLLEQQVEKEKKEYLYLMADFDNFRKRTVKEKADLIRNASEKAMADLLPVIDDFERGIEANRNTDDPEILRQGMELIYNKFVKYLERYGVKPIESTGQVFDPEIHEAIAMVPVTDEEQKGKVIDTPTKGYKINDKVLRHAKVAVGQ